jgi:hypothetical protein
MSPSQCMVLLIWSFVILFDSSSTSIQKWKPGESHRALTMPHPNLLNPTGTALSRLGLVGTRLTNSLHPFSPPKNSPHSTSNEPSSAVKNPHEGVRVALIKVGSFEYRLPKNRSVYNRPVLTDQSRQTSYRRRTVRITPRPPRIPRPASAPVGKGTTCTVWNP